jgi:hypothetical protein
VATRPTNSLKNDRFFDLASKKFKILPHRSEFPLVVSLLAWPSSENFAELLNQSINP